MKNPWQPIETAPIGEQVLAYKPDEGYFLITPVRDGVYRESFTGEVFSGGVTHWTTLPEPPQ